MPRNIFDRIYRELNRLEQATVTVQESLQLAEQRPDEARFFVAAAAFEMHSFYTGLEKIFEVIAKRIDQQLPRESQWHSILLNQMAQEIADIRPAVISDETHLHLRDFLGFRHVIRNVYVFNLRSEDVTLLGRKLPNTFALVQHDLRQFVDFLNTIDI